MKSTSYPASNKEPGPRPIKQPVGEQIFDLINLFVLGIIGLLALYPFLYTLSLSLSTVAEAHRSSLHLYPQEVSFDAYRLLFKNAQILTCFGNSVVRTVLGTVLTAVCTCVAAYPLSRKSLPFRNLILFLILLTMIFGGGVVPGYLLVRSLGLLNTVWALILPGLLSAFNILLVKNFFQQLPESLHEAATLDGASEWQILLQVYMPLSRPIVATISLWTAVAHWNGWFDAMLYITDNHKQVLQCYLQRIVIENSTQLIDLGKRTSDAVPCTPETLKSATVILTVLPMLIIYPLVQKYFVNGILIGGVKE